MLRAPAPNGRIIVTTYAMRHPEAAVLQRLAVLLYAGARGVAAAAKRLDAWLESRRLESDARRDLSEMTDRELLDVGLMTPAMRDVATRAAAQAGLSAIVSIRAGFFEQLPVEDGSVDVVISNGVVNLAPDKSLVFAEIARVLRPGGRLYLADVVVQRELKYEVRSSPELWAACIAGALPEFELAELALASGLRDPRITERFDSFRDTTAEAKVARDLRVQAVNFLARK